MSPIRVLVVDDSAVFRTVVSQALATDPEIEVIGTAPDPTVAWPIIRKERPDVVTLDIEMPRMDGLTFLTSLMTHAPMPVVVVSSLTARGCEVSLRALSLGAVDVVEKPGGDLRETFGALSRTLVEKVRTAAFSRPRPGAAPRPAAAPRPRPAPVAAGSPLPTDQVIALGASTGGTEALLAVLATLPADAPGGVVVQHMPARFTRPFAERLDRSCAVRVKEAEDGEPLLVGQVLVAPGDRHMRVERKGVGYRVLLAGDPPQSGHRPSVDVLFHSCAASVGKKAVGVILTGMGADGADGLVAMKRAGAITLAQDEQTCVVFGMPREAIARGGVDKVLPLDGVGEAIMRAVRGRGAL